MVTEDGMTLRANPDPKRQDPYFDHDLGVIRSRPYEQRDRLSSMRYIAPSVRAVLRAVADGEPQETDRVEYQSPDGPIEAIFYGQLGTGQWR